MARTYSKPPLIEVVCDFKFLSSQPWDWTIPGLFYERIRDRFPTKEQLNIIETVVDPNQGKVVQQAQPKLQFASVTRNEVIRIGPNNLSIHQLPPYDGWIHFKKRVFEYLQIYSHVANSSGLANVGLRYVNHIELSHNNETLEEYFRVIPQIPPPIPQAFPTFLLNVDIPYNSPSSVLRIIFGTVVPKIPSDLAYVLDLNMYSMNDNVPSTEAILDWLEAAHERIEVAFNASFTEKAHYELFGEINK